MQRFFRNTGTTWSVNTVIEQAYALKPTGTQIEDSSLRAGASRALRDANPGLPMTSPAPPAEPQPDDDATISTTTFPFLWVPSIPRIPHRIPTANLAATRIAIESLGIHDVTTLARIHLPWLVSKLPAVSEANLAKVMAVSRLSRIRGMNGELALALWDAGITTPALLRDATQVAIKAAISTLIPNDLMSRRPWAELQRAAVRFARKRSRGRPARYVAALNERRLAPELDFWREEQSSSRRSAAERLSASVIWRMYQIQRAIARGNAAWARGRGRAAHGQYREVWTQLGAAAVAFGLTSEGTAEAIGPSIDLIVKVTGAALRLIHTTDVDLARRRLGLPNTTPDEGILSLRHVDVASPNDLNTAIGSLPLYSLSRRALLRAAAYLSDTTVTGLGTTLKAGITAGGDVRVAHLRAGDQEVLFENVGACKFDQYPGFSGATAPWSTFRADLQLADLPSSVHGSLTGTAHAVATSAARTYWGSVLNDMQPFDRMYSWRPSRRPKDVARRVPLSLANFERLYRRDILVFLRDEREQDVWHFDLEDVADPARFCFLLPAIVARPLWRAYARTMNPSGLTEATRGATLGANRALMTVSETVSSTMTVDQAMSEGSVIPSEDVWSEPEGFTSLLEAEVAAGDSAYRRERINEARSHYERVLTECREAAPNSFTHAADNIAGLHAAMVREVHAAVERGVRPSVSVADFAVVDTVNDTATPIFPGLVPGRPSELDATQRLVARVPGATEVIFYGGGLGDYGEDQDSFILRMSESPPFDQSELFETDEEIDLVDIDVILPGLPPAPGFPPPGGDPPQSVFGPAEQRMEVIDVDVIEGLILHASTQLAKISAGLNWLGLDPDVVPPWRFDHLLQQARYYAQKADELQQRAMALLQAAEAKTLEEAQAAAAADAADAAVTVALAQEALAHAQLDAAVASEDAADLAAKHSKDDAWQAALTGGLTAFAAVVASTVLAPSTGGLSVAAAAAAGGASTLASIDRANEGKQEAFAQAEVAKRQVDVAEQQVSVSAAETALAQIQDKAAQEYLALVAEAQLSSSKYYQLQNVVGHYSTAYLTMATRLAFLAERAHEYESRRYSEYIRLGYGAQDTVEGMFQSGARLLKDLDALAHERVTSVTERYQIIKTSFDLLVEFPEALLQLRNGGSCVVRIDPMRLDLRFPGLYLHNLKRLEVELDGLFPPSGVTGVLRITNNSFVRVPNDATYVKRRNRVVADWAYPEGEYPISAPAPESEGPPPAQFVQKPLMGLGLRQILSEYRRATDSVVLAPPEGALDAFENLSTDLLFTLTIPKSGNGFDLSAISGGRVTLYFTAHYSEALAQRQAAQLSSIPEVGRAAILVATTHAAASFAAFKAAPLDPKRYDLRLLSLPLTQEHLFAHTGDRRIQNFQVVLGGLAGRSLLVRVAGAPIPFALPNQTTYTAGSQPNTTVPDYVPDGMVFTAIGEPSFTEAVDGFDYASRAGSYPALENSVTAARNLDRDVVGTWVVKVLPDAPNEGFRLKDDDGNVIATTTTQLQLTNGSVRRVDGGSLHGTTRVIVQLGGPTTPTPTVFSLRQRLGASGTVESTTVTAELAWKKTGHLRLKLLCDDVLKFDSDDVAVNDTSLDAPIELALRVFGTTAEFWLDGVLLATVDDLEPPVSDDGVGVEAAGTATKIKQLTHDQLRYDGTPLTRIIDEPFSTLTDWTGTGHSLVSDTRYQLDLSFLQDVLLQVDYTAQLQVEYSTPSA